MTIKYSSAGLPLWTNRYNGPGNDDDEPSALAVDASDNVYVTGSSAGSGSGLDILTIKYSAAGTALWTNRFNSTGNSIDGAIAIALDTNGNAYVTGSSFGNGSDYDWVTIKYSAAGAGLWTNTFNGSGNDYDQPYGLAVDATGSAYVTGVTTGIGTGWDYLTIKYSPEGLPLWTNIFNGSANGNDSANAVALDTNGNVYVTGNFTRGAGDFDWATIKYSSMGLPIWTNTFQGKANDLDAPLRLAVDSNSNIYVTGYSHDSTYQDGLTIKYSSSGAALWTNVINSPVNLGAVGNAVTVDAIGNVYVAGFSVVGDNSSDFVTIKYSGAASATSVCDQQRQPGIHERPVYLNCDRPTRFRSRHLGKWRFTNVGSAGHQSAIWRNAALYRSAR